MKERIVLASGAGGGELLKSLALHGANCFNLRIFSSVDLARYLLTKSGITVKEGFINQTEENVYVVKALAGETYFGKVTYNDVVQIATTIRQMRSLAVNEADLKDILENGLFKEKNEALYSAYRKYMDLLAKNAVFDSISYVRNALENCREMDAEFITVKEFPATPLENALLEKVSGGTVKCIGIQELFGKEDKSVHLESIRKCYGAPNEVETILSEIYSTKNLDQCTVALTDADTYSQLFFDYALLYEIPVTFGCGVPIMNANPAKLLVLYYQWITGGFYGMDALNQMLNSEAFDLSKLYEEIPEDKAPSSRGTFRDMLGDIRYTDNKKQNKERFELFQIGLEEEIAATKEDNKDYANLLERRACLPALEIMAEEFSLPVEDFITKYAYIRTFGNSNAESMLRKIDYSALDVIYNELKAIRYSGIEQSTDDIIKNVLSHNVCIQRMEAGSLHITQINKAFSGLRQNLYIAGLSSLKFPGSPTENYLLLDTDLNHFGDCAKPYTSQGRILSKKDRLLSLVKLAAALESRIYLSYAGLNVSELKKENASSSIYELFREEHGKDATSKDLEAHITEIAYFEPKISYTREIGNAYNAGKTVLQTYTQKLEAEEGIAGDLEKSYSPSAILNYFSCPRLFMLANLLGIPQPSESDPFEVIPANDNGTLAHTLMEKLADNKMSEEEFLSLSSDTFDRYLMQHPPLVNTNAAEIKKSFLDMMQNAYESDPGRKVVLAEEDIYCDHESGIKIHGFPDRVEELDDGTYLVVDYKTGGSLHHSTDDVKSCLQVVIYAYLMEHRSENPLPVSGGEFRYIKINETVKCKYDEETKAALNELLLQFKNGLKEGTYPIVDPQKGDDNPCQYCKYISICGKMEA